MEMRWNFPPWITETGVITVFQYYQNIAVIHFVFSVKFQSASLLFFYVYSPYLTTFPFILLLCKYLFRHRYTVAHKNIRTLVEIFCEYIMRSTMFHHFDDHHTTLLFVEGTKYLTQYLAQWWEKNLSRWIIRYINKPRYSARSYFWNIQGNERNVYLIPTLNRKRILFTWDWLLRSFFK